MTTMHFSKEDIAALVVADDGSLTIELTDKGVRDLEAQVSKRAAKRALNVQISSPRSEDGFAAGFRAGYANGQGPGMPPLRA